MDSHFVRALCESISSGRTTYSEAYRLTNTSRKTFSEIAVRLERGCIMGDNEIFLVDSNSFMTPFDFIMRLILFQHIGRN